MQLTSILLVAVSLHVSAKTLSQSITYSGKNVKLETVFKSIEKQTGYFVFYEDNLISEAGKISINCRNMPLEQFLTEILTGQPFSFLLEKTTIFIRKKQPVFNLTDILPIPPAPVKGRIVNEENEPVLATVTVKGSKVSAPTNANGEFDFQDISDDATLLITGVGIENLEIKVQGRADLGTIRTKKRVVETEVVVVMGYGTQSKRDLTGAVGQVKSDEIENLPLISLEQALQGRISGVKVKRNSGDPKGNFGVNIRGMNSTSNGGQPLYVVDGVPLAAGTLTNINPSDIASLDVLKDASATAIYGSRAANGVVMITTKTGSGRGRDVIDFNTEVGMLTPIIPFKMADAFLQAQIVKESLTEAQIAIPSRIE